MDVFRILMDFSEGLALEVRDFSSSESMHESQSGNPARMKFLLSCISGGETPPLRVDTASLPCPQALSPSFVSQFSRLLLLPRWDIVPRDPRPVVTLESTATSSHSGRCCTSAELEVRMNE